jgi:hypothetical protein
LSLPERISTNEKEKTMGRIWLTLSATLAALLVLSLPVYAADTTYEPFVTDFPRASPDGTGAEYVPFVTDFPQGAHGSPTAAPAAGGFDWEAAGAISVGVVALGALLAALLLTRRHRRVAVALGED